jgi:hypothetical protein
MRPLETDFALFGTNFVQYEPNRNVNNFILITKHSRMKRPTIFPKRLKRPGLVTYGIDPSQQLPALGPIEDHRRLSSKTTPRNFVFL